MDESKVTITVNGTARSFLVDKATTLLEILRDHLNLTGAKEGCGYGKCGTCTVVMNGEAVRSCIVKAVKADGASVTTIEGVTDGYTLHPIQEALIEAGAIQCGFCTPGIVMTLHALLAKNPDIPDGELKQALNGHLCRCTGYESILKAGFLAREKMQKHAPVKA
ncbi:MAG: (2Fe-2S)-binding protein [Candidatus Eremiobacteraeota bacterium]|nr:(2Fe-2S)-binding protein [Candidatus Eremiobacteraeota bacterium]